MENVGGESSKKESVFTSFVNRVGGVFLAPEETFNHIITGHVSFWEPLLIILMLVIVEGAVLCSFAYRIVSAINDAFSLLTGGTFSFGFFGIVLAVMIVAMVAALISWVIIAGIAHLIAEGIFKGSGSYVQLLKLYGYTFVPYSLVIFGTVLIGLSWTTWPIAAFFYTITTFWVVLLMAVAVRHNYKIDVGKAFISSFIGPMLLWLLVVGLFWVLILLTFGGLMGGLV